MQLVAHTTQTTDGYRVFPMLHPLDVLELIFDSHITVLIVAFRTIVNGFIKGLRFFLVPLEHNLTRSSTV